MKPRHPGARVFAPEDEIELDLPLGLEPPLAFTCYSLLAGEPGHAPVPDDEELKRRVRRVLEKIRSGPPPAPPQSTLTASELLHLSPEERWSWPLAAGSVWTPQLLQDLLRQAEDEIARLSAVAEEKLHFILSLAARLPAATCGGAFAADLMAQAWVLLAECALQKDDPAQARSAAGLARAHLDCGSGDSLVLLEVNQRWALLEWATGEEELAREVFESLARLARSVGEPELEARQQLWLYLLADQEVDAATAEQAHRRALALLGPDEFPRALKIQLETARRLGCARLSL